MKMVSLVRLSTELLNRENIPSAMRQEYSLYPVKFGKLMKKRYQIGFECLSMAPGNHAACLHSCYEYGADNVYLLNDKCFAGSDTYASSLILAEAIKTLIQPVELIVCCMQSSQGETGHIASALAARLQIPAVIGVVNICEIYDDYMVCVQDHEYYHEKVSIHFPAVISLHRNINFGEELEENTLFDMRNARKKAVQQLSHEDIGLSSADCGLKGSKTRMVSGRSIALNQNHENFAGSTLEQCGLLLQLMNLQGGV